MGELSKTDSSYNSFNPHTACGTAKRHAMLAAADGLAIHAPDRQVMKRINTWERHGKTTARSSPGRAQFDRYRAHN
ncbi:hypothetical protein J6590_055356 [Homalodisca vitripennis]|nr:hypothetical protein J6590_055356 [Homalodisca vitripennis]